ncbi:MAG: PH domain-containing protein [Phycisphaerales bacterium]|nr:MAG: PH domain-containing protein [Phycisphaerales bacterium]
MTNATPPPPSGNARFDPASITHPDRSLLTYYALVSALGLVLFPFIFIPLMIKYNTLRYRLDEDGVSMAWGLLFRKEVHLTYRRIQDIHVTRNLFHRWLGLAQVAIQTASGSAGAEMTIEGVRHPEALRDYLYTKMRGAREDERPDDADDGAPEPHDEALALLGEIRDELRALRSLRGGGS